MGMVNIEVFLGVLNQSNEQVLFRNVCLKSGDQMRKRPTVRKCVVDFSTAVFAPLDVPWLTNCCIESHPG